MNSHTNLKHQYISYRSKNKEIEIKGIKISSNVTREKLPNLVKEVGK